MSTFAKGGVVKISPNANKWLKAELNQVGIILAINLYGWEEPEAFVNFNFEGSQPRTWWLPFSALKKAKLPEPRKTFALVDAVLAWWKEHQYDSYSDGDGEEYNVYRDTPDFVKLAQELEKHED